MENGGYKAAVLLGIYSTFALDVFSTLNSSPQTTELFAGDRKDSLLHWVYIGDAVAIGGGLIATYYSGRAWPILAAGSVAVGMHLLYKHAVARGEGKTPPAGATV